MCEHGDTVPVRVLVVARLSHSGRDEWKTKPIDRCIAPIVDALQEADIRTLGSCCGHGKAPGLIPLDDGRTLIVASPRHRLADGLRELLRLRAVLAPTPGDQ